MIKIKVCNLIGEKKMTRKELAKAINVRPNTIGDLYNGKVKKIDLDILNKLCIYFNCEIRDILEHIKEVIPQKQTIPQPKNNNLKTQISKISLSMSGIV